MSSIREMFRGPSGSPFLCNVLDIPSGGWGCFCFLPPVWNPAFCFLILSSQISLSLPDSVCHILKTVHHIFCADFSFLLGVSVRRILITPSWIKMKPTNSSDSHRIYYFTFAICYFEKGFLFIYKQRNTSKFLHFILNPSPV